MVQPGLVHLERGGQVEDGPPVLDGRHQPGGERLAVPDAVDLVEDGDGGVPGPQEVGVERVHPPELHRAARCHEGLGGHLAAEHLLALLGGLDAPEDVDLDRFEVEQADQEVEGLAHRDMLAGPAAAGRTRYGAPMIEFPEGFLWGTATAAHQIEGGNVNNDWWAFEHDPDSGCVESSGDACDSFHRWREDVDLVADLGLGAYRFSLEWSRIEPAEGEWSVAALDHYRRICAACLGRGIQPVVTFHHFTTPLWLAARGGWEAPDAPERFARFCERAVAHLGDLIGWGCTLNEPNVVGVMGYTMGAFPPG